jgi:hypothetical protein
MTQVQRIIRLQQTLDKIAEKVEKPCWVKAGFLTEKTGWNNEKLRQARAQGIVEWEKRETGFWYNINSVPQVFIKS